MMRFIPSCSSASQWCGGNYLSVISRLFIKVHDRQKVWALTRLIACPDKEIFLNLSCRRIRRIRVRNIRLVLKVETSSNEQYAQRQERYLVNCQPTHFFPPHRDILRECSRRSHPTPTRRG